MINVGSIRIVGKNFYQFVKKLVSNVSTCKKRIKIEGILTLLGIPLQTKNSSLAGSSIFTPIVVCARTGSDYIKYSHSVIRPPHETLTIIIEFMHW